MLLDLFLVGFLDDLFIGTFVVFSSIDAIVDGDEDPAVAVRFNEDVLFTIASNPPVILFGLRVVEVESP